MEQKVNQRILLTKKLVHEAFISILSEKSIQQISIRELCEKAGINRTTFYNHYGNQYDVLDELSGQYLEAIADVIESTELSAHDRTLERVTLVLQYMLDNRELSLLLINNNVDKTFASRLFSLPKIETLLNAALSDRTDPLEKQSCIDFVIAGGYKLLLDWINMEEPTKPEKEAALILELARRVCTKKI